MPLHKRGFFFEIYLIKMYSSKSDCKVAFQKAYENRYTWPKNFNGYKGNCILQENTDLFNGDFVIGKNFQPRIKNIKETKVVEKISSQLFEVVIHRVKKSFEEVHSKNEFRFLKQSEKGIEMEVLGKNDGDKYRVNEGKINMVYRKIHGVIIEIFVEDFFDTGNGFLSTNYSSQQLDIDSLKPKTQKYSYKDNFIKIKNTNLWVLESRTINQINIDEEKLLNQYTFRNIETL